MERYTLIDQNNWKRKDHFNLFKSFEDPYFSITVEVEISKTFNYIKKRKYPVFFSYLYLAVKAANQVREFRTVYHDGEIREYKSIHGSSTIFREDETYAVSYLPYFLLFKEFLENSIKEFDLRKSQRGLVFPDNDINVMHISSLPWTNFTSIKHPFSSKDINTCPKLVFGKFIEKEAKLLMPLSVDVHHGLADGYHVSKFLRIYQEYLNEPDENLK